MSDIYINPFLSPNSNDSMRSEATARFDSNNPSNLPSPMNYKPIISHLAEMRPRMITTVLDKANEALKKSAQITGSNLHTYSTLPSHQYFDSKPPVTKKVVFEPPKIENSSNDWEEFHNDLNPSGISPKSTNAPTSFISDYLPSKYIADSSYLSKFNLQNPFSSALPSHQIQTPNNPFIANELKKSQELLKALDRIKQEAEFNRPVFHSKLNDDIFTRPPVSFQVRPEFLIPKFDDAYFKPELPKEPRAVSDPLMSKSPSISPQRDSKRSSPGMHVVANHPKAKYVEEYYDDGTVYRGEKIKGIKTGKGEFQYADGRVYDGEWENDLKSGYGVLKSNEGEVLYEGEWKEDKFHGNGLLMNDKFQEEPSFNYNRFETLKNGWISFEGEFASGKKHGLGTLILPKGQKFIGKFRYDKVHGTGTFYQNDGSTITGDWEDNRLAKKA